MSEEILSFEIVIDAKLSDETKENLETLKESKEKKTTPSDDAGDLLAAEGELTGEQLEEIKADIMGELGDMKPGDLAQLGSFSKNPTAFLSKIMGSNITKILGPVAIATLAAAVSIEVIKLMSTKGGPLNRDWRRFISEEVAVGLTRLQDKEDLLGITQTILTQIVGFEPNNENFTYNSLYNRGDNRLARIGLSDRVAGVSLFLG